MKSKDTASVRYYLSAHKSEFFGGVAVLSTIAALGIANSVITDENVRTCSPIEVANPEVSNPNDLLRDFEVATGQYASVHNLDSLGGTVYMSKAPYIDAVFETIGSSKLTDLRKPAIASMGHLVCLDTDNDVTSYRLTQKAQTGAEALIKAGVANPALSDLVNQE